MKNFTMKQPGLDNPFYGKKDLNQFYELSSKPGNSGLDSALQSAWQSCQTLEDRQLFWSMVFAMGDIPNRNHQIFQNSEKEQGGHGNRIGFISAMRWAQKNTPEQWKQFLSADLIRQYSSLDTILMNRVKTRAKTSTILETFAIPSEFMTEIADYIARLIRKDNPIDNVALAKFLTNVKTGTRQKIDLKTKEKTGSRKLQSATQQNMQNKSMFYVELSNKLDWEIFKHENWIDFRGLRQWKRKWNGELESVLFSTGKIAEYDKVQFWAFLDKCPAGARYRVKRRLIGVNDKIKPRWVQQANWYLGWEKNKEILQSEQRQLQESVRQGIATDEDKKRLKEVAKAAKVTVGGNTLFESLDKFLNKNESDNLLIQSILDKIKFEVPVLAIADCSGSMQGLASKVCTFLSTVVMLKNPSVELDDILIRFGSTAEILCSGTDVNGVRRKNRFVQSTSVKYTKLVDRTENFWENYRRISQIVAPNLGGTAFNVVGNKISAWIESDSDLKQYRIEQLQSYPVFIVVSDGDMNSSSNAAQSMMDFRREMARWGWDGVVVVWDVNTGAQISGKFSSVPNTLHFMGWNLGIVNQVFTKIHDLDIIDVYLPLKTLWQSNRYELVRQNTI